MKKFIAGLLTGIFLMVSGIALAAGPEQVTAFLRGDYTVTLDGKPVKLSKTPITVDGSMYLPLRDVAKAVDMDVTWEGSTMTAKLQTKSTPANTTQGRTQGDDEAVTNETIEYIPIKTLIDTYDGYDFRYENGQMDFVRFTTNPKQIDQYEILYENVPYIVLESRAQINKDFFETTLLPLIRY